MKNKKIIIIIISILVVILLMVGLYFYGLTSVSKNSDKVTFNIESGSSTLDIIDNLKEANLIKSKVSSLIYVKLNNKIIKSGSYELDRSMSTKEIFNILSDGKIIDNTITLTFIEGKRLLDYVELISDNFPYTKEEILDVISDSNYLNELVSKYSFLSNNVLDSDIYYPLEGYLFPSTYEFYQDASIKDIIEKMLAKTGNVLDNNIDSINASGYDVHEILTMASIIENETMYDSDRSIVSQVIHKRLGINMNLGMDVTTYYGVQKSLKEELTQSDLASKNAYNTRDASFIGLPVGPISNPSENSIKAALNPSDTDYLYFYAEVSSGKLHFANTYQEFQELIRKYS